MDIEQLLSDKTKRIGLVTAHADDETLFAGGMLSKYGGENWRLITCFLPYNCGDYDWSKCVPRLNECANICKKIGMGWHFLSFPSSRLYVEADAYYNLIFAAGQTNLPDLYRVLIDCLVKSNFDAIITHNIFGEYGAPQHVLVNNVVKSYQGLLRPKAEFYTFAMSGDGILDSPDYMLVLDDELYEKKKALISCYQGKKDTLLRYKIVQCRKEALWHEVH